MMPSPRWPAGLALGVLVVASCTAGLAGTAPPVGTPASSILLGGAEVAAEDAAGAAQALVLARWSVSRGGAGARPALATAVRHVCRRARRARQACAEAERDKCAARVPVETRVGPGEGQQHPEDVHVVVLPLSIVTDDGCLFVSAIISGLLEGVQYEIGVAAEGVATTYLAAGTGDDYVLNWPLKPPASDGSSGGHPILQPASGEVHIQVFAVDKEAQKQQDVTLETVREILGARSWKIEPAEFPKAPGPARQDARVRASHSSLSCSPAFMLTLRVRNASN